MMIQMFSPHTLILDASCGTNLNASGRMGEVLDTLAKRTVMSEYVARKGMSWIDTEPVQEIQQPEPNELNRLVTDNRLALVDLQTESEAIEFVNHVAVLRDDGEACTITLAHNRNWALATDDRRVLSYLAKHLPSIPSFSTPQLVKHWSEVRNVEIADIAQLIRLVEIRGKYACYPDNPLYNWWHQLASGILPKPATRSA